MMKAEFIQQLLQQNLPGAAVTVTGDGYHFQAEIISPEFAGLGRVQRQQKVYAILNSYIQSGELHAITLITKAPEE